MLHVFIDTNVFLSLYAYTDDNIEELKKILALIQKKELKLYISVVVNQEFYRNRDKKIFESLGNLERFSTSLSIPRFVEHHDEAKDLRNLLKEVEAKRKVLVSKAKQEIISHSLAADKLFLELRSSEQLASISDEIDKAARLRMERGNPPGKDGSLGDRINWEFLLNKVPDGEDIHILSRDKDYSSPFGENIPNSFLFGEWATLKKGKLHLYSGMKTFFAEHFPEIFLASDTEKIIAIKRLNNSKSFKETHEAISVLHPLISDFSKDEAKSIFQAIFNNPEIYSISSDEDVSSFYDDMHTEHWDVLSPDEFEHLDKLIDISVPF